MIPQATIARIKDRILQFGHRASWAGDAGMLAADCDRLLAELKRTQERVAELEVELSRWHERGRWFTER